MSLLKNSHKLLDPPLKRYSRYQVHPDKGTRQTQDSHHEELVNGLHNQLKQIFDSSEQAIYLYLDDSDKVCNEKFAEMQGYNSPEEWAKVENPLEVGVD